MNFFYFKTLTDRKASEIMPRLNRRFRIQYIYLGHIPNIIGLDADSVNTDVSLLMHRFLR
jgi:hypothetical protein